MPRIAHKNFTGGEVSPTLTGRYDLERYATSVQCMENMLPGLHGDAARRPGTRFVADLGGYAVLIPFSFSVEADQNFVLVMSHKALRVSDGAGALCAPVATPYAAADLLRLSWAQVGDIVYLAHPAYPLHKIMRSPAGSGSGYTWSVGQVVLNESIDAPAAPEVTFNGSGGSFALRYKVVAVDARGRESLPSPPGQAANGKHPSDWVQGNSAAIRWQAVAGATEYNIYRESAGYYGFIGICRAEDAQAGPMQTLSFLDNNYEAKTDDTPKEDWNPFANGNHPATVSFHQQRMVLGGGTKNPQTFYMSRTGDFENFRKSRPLQDDDPVEYMVASGSMDAIQWMASFGDLLLGTSGSEYKATGENGVITPKNAAITAQSYWGSAGLAPLVIGNSILHVQRHGSRVRDLFYSLEKDGYAGNDLSIMAPHLFEGHTILQWAYQQTPGSRIWCVRDDGILLVLTYLKEHQIFGWSRHVTQGRVLSVAAISGDNGDVVLMAVQREVGGRPRVFLERLAEPFAPDTAVENAFLWTAASPFAARTAYGSSRVLTILKAARWPCWPTAARWKAAWCARAASNCRMRPILSTPACPTPPCFPRCRWRRKHRRVPPWAGVAAMAAVWCVCSAASAANTGQAATSSTTFPSCPHAGGNRASRIPAMLPLRPAADNARTPPSGWCRANPCRGMWWPLSAMWTSGRHSRGTFLCCRTVFPHPRRGRSPGRGPLAGNRKSPVRPANGRAHDARPV